MLRNYLTIAIRNLHKQRFYAFINIMGLAVGLASCLLITLFVLDHLGYDTFHQHAARIYRVNYKAKLTADGDPYHIGATPPPVARILTNEFPEIELATRVYPKGSSPIQYKDKSFEETDILAVDTNFFKLFSFKMLEGNIATVFRQPDAVVVTKEMARKYFGNQPAMGKILTIGDKPYQVTGVAENPPHNSHFTFHVLTSIAAEEQVKRFDWSWVWSALTTYVQLKEGVSAENLESKLPGIIKRHAGNTIERLFGTSFDEFAKSGNTIQLSLQPLTDIHLYSDAIQSGLGTHGNVKYLYIFSCVALFILLLACINFMNLSTARSIGRSKEVGIRKVLGSEKHQLIFQFLTESLLISMLAMLVALGISELLLQFFSDDLLDGLNHNLLNQRWLWVIAVGLVFLVGVLAGSYPAFYLSSFKPVEVLKGTLGTRRSKTRFGVSLRNGLVVFQFAVSVFLIICTMLVFQQLNYLKNKNLGFDKENILVIKNTDRMGTNAQAFKQQLSRLPEVVSTSFSTGLPATHTDVELFIQEGKDKLLNFVVADYDYVQTLGIQLKKGRNFSKDFPSDAGEEGGGAIIINEAAARQLGWKNPIGESLISQRGSGNKQEIVGIFRNYHFKSLHTAIEPLLIVLSTEGDYLSVRVRPGDVQRTIQIIENQWKRYAPNAPFDYSFLDDNFNAQYKTEQQIGRLFSVFTSLAVFIACLGVFGLAAFTAEQRTKEIGIRKVLGASVFQVVRLLSGNFLKLVLLANVLAWPVAWYAVNQWLQDFAYKINIAWWIFALASVLALLIALVTVSFQAIKAALANPVNSLRSE